MRGAEPASRLLVVRAVRRVNVRRMPEVTDRTCVPKPGQLAREGSRTKLLGDLEIRRAYLGV